MAESLPQAGLQIWILTYEGLDDSNIWYSVFRVFSIVVSVLSVLYGLCKVISRPENIEYILRWKNLFCFFCRCGCCDPPSNNENDLPLDSE